MNCYLFDPQKLNPIEEYDSERVVWLINKIEFDGKWTSPISISREHNLVMDGHHRLEAAIRLKLKRVPCFIFSYEKIEQKL